MNYRLRQTMDEDELPISRVLAGDREAFRGLIARHQAAVCATIAALQPRGSDCEDLAQDVFLAAFRHLGQFDSLRGSFRTWLLAIARNACRNAQPRAVFAQFEEVPEFADARTPEMLASESEWFERLDRGLAALPEEQRLAFVLVEMQGLSYQAAAAIAEVNVGTVKSRVHRAKAALRELLRPYLNDTERVSSNDGSKRNDTGGW
jgi:RNA polymerase sigma-70 factor (ECF subfamily)